MTLIQLLCIFFIIIYVQNDEIHSVSTSWSELLIQHFSQLNCVSDSEVWFVKKSNVDLILRPYKLQVFQILRKVYKNIFIYLNGSIKNGTVQNSFKIVKRNYHVQAFETYWPCFLFFTFLKLFSNLNPKKSPIVLTKPIFVIFTHIFKFLRWTWNSVFIYNLWVFLFSLFYELKF